MSPRDPLESFAADRMAVDAVVRNRHLLIHEYFGVSVAIIWETISRDLRSVREAIRRDVERS